MNKTIIGVSLFSFSVLFSATTFAQTTPDYAKLIEQAHQKYKSNNDGKVADYIPALATYSPKKFCHHHCDGGRQDLPKLAMLTNLSQWNP